MSLVDYAPFILIFGGLLTVSWLLEKLDGSPMGEKAVGKGTRTFSYLGFFVGILLITTAAVAWSTQKLDVGTRYLLIITGLSLFLKPIKDVPWAALIGLVAGCACAGYAILVLPVPGTVFGISSKWIYLLAFLVPALLAYLLFKFVEDLLRLIGAILTFKPVTIVLGLVCIVQGILMLLDNSLFTILLH